MPLRTSKEVILLRLLFSLERIRVYLSYLVAKLICFHTNYEMGCCWSTTEKCQ